MSDTRTDVTFPRDPHLHQFDIARGGDGLWHVDDREGLIGGVFRTRKAAIRFAMFEADWDRTCVHLHRRSAAPVHQAAKR
jgi:hypothetical protein